MVSGSKGGISRRYESRSFRETHRLNSLDAIKPPAGEIGVGGESGKLFVNSIDAIKPPAGKIGVGVGVKVVGYYLLLNSAVAIKPTAGKMVVGVGEK